MIRKHVIIFECFQYQGFLVECKDFIPHTLPGDRNKFQHHKKAICHGGRESLGWNLCSIYPKYTKCVPVHTLSIQSPLETTGVDIDDIKKKLGFEYWNDFYEKVIENWLLLQKKGIILTKRKWILLLLLISTGGAFGCFPCIFT